MAMTTGLVLTGGGLRGVCAQAGALLALEEAGYRFDAVIGTSAGAIVGALYASGLSAAALDERLRTLTNDDFLDPIGRLPLAFALARELRGVTGYYRGEALLWWLRRNLRVERIEDCPLPLFVTVTNVSRGVPQVKTAGPLAAFARASSAIPLVFAAQRVGDEYYADGGAANNVPVDELVRLRPDLEQLVVLTALRVERPEPEPDNGFLREKWTPVRALGRVLDAVAEGQRLDNLDVPQKIVVVRARTLSLDLDDADRVGEAIDLAHTTTAQRIAAGEIDLSDVPRVP
jgi:NTE family protein